VSTKQMVHLIYADDGATMGAPMGAFGNSAQECSEKSLFMSENICSNRSEFSNAIRTQLGLTRPDTTIIFTWNNGSLQLTTQSNN